jgi:hypothetical protein
MTDISAMSNLDFDAAVEQSMGAIQESEDIHPDNKQSLAD